MRTVAVIAILSTIFAAALAGRAAAQTDARFYAGAAAGTFTVSADDVDGTSMAGGFVGGIAVEPWLDVEVELVVPTAAFTLDRR
jgi:hypothetical protein